MVRTFRAEYAGGQVLAVNEAVKLGKLVQICCGVAYGPHGNRWYCHRALASSCAAA